MSMQIIPDENLVVHDSFSQILIDYLKSSESRLQIEDSSFFFDFPIYSNDEGNILRVTALLITRKNGVFLFASSDARGNDTHTLTRDCEKTEEIFSNIFSRFVKIKELRKSRTRLQFDFECILYATNFSGNVDNFDLRIINNLKQLDDVISEQHSSINQSVFDKIISVVDGQML